MLYLFGCSNSNQVKVNSFSPEGETDAYTYIKVNFSEDIAPTDKIDEWLDTDLIKFKPEIDGKFKWTDNRTLIFSPNVALLPSQKYTAEIRNGVLSNKKYSADFDEYHFHTQYFNVLKAEYFWTRIKDEEYKISVKANLFFNYSVLPDMLRQFLTITVNGEKISGFNIITEESSKVIAIDLGDIKQTNNKQDIVITVDKGLKSVVSDYALEEKNYFKYKLPPITKLAITGVSSGFDGTKGWIFVNTTQEVKKSEILKYISLTPAKKIKISTSDNGFKIEADFMKAKRVNLLIKKGLPGVYGGELEFDYEQELTLVDIEPNISFTSQSGKYLLLGGNENVEVNTVNVKAVEIEVSKIYENNILHFLNNYSYYYNDYYGYKPTYYTGNYGDKLYSKKIKLNSERNWQNTFNINLNDVLNSDKKGLYTINVRSDDRRWLNDSKMVVISDLGIIAKKSEKNIIVFVNRISTAEPVEGVEVNIISSKNQSLLKGLTDADGVVQFQNVKDKIGSSIPILVTCELNNDFNYIDFRETEIETSRFDVGGIVQYSNLFNAYIYSPRDIYRPGEDVVLSAIVRDSEIGVPDNIPVFIKIISPSGKIFGEFKKMLNDEGSFELKFPLPDYAQTGNYYAELSVNSKQMIGTYTIKVEEFVPDKIRVFVNSNKSKYKLNEKIKFNLNAEYLFGAKASGLKYEADIQLRPRTYWSEKFANYNFANSSVSNQTIENSFVDGKLDEEGNSVFEYKIPNSIKASSYIQGTAFTSVFDLTGRTVNKAAMFKVYPNEYFIGISPMGYYHGTNKNILYKFVAVDKDDNPLSKFLCEVELVRFEWQTVLRKGSNGKYYYASEKQENSEWRKELVLNGETNFSFKTDKSGMYEVRIYKKGSVDYHKNDFYVYGWNTSTASTFEVNKEGRVEMVFNKTNYEPGEEATLLLTTPFSGKLLVTFERDKIYDYRIIDVKNKSAEIKFEIPETFLPNIYVSATLFKAHNQENGTPFLVGHGYESIKIEQKDNRLPLQITAPTKCKPRQKQTISLKTIKEKNVYVTLAVVDEGILQLNNFNTPDAYNYIYEKRPLTVESFDLYKLLLPEIVSSKSSTGGDALASEFKKRTNPIKSKRFNLVSYWSGIKKTNSNGEVEIEFDIPQFNGELRVMAMAYTGKRFGNADAKIKVADKIIVEAEIPRVLTMGDSLVSKVTILNPNNLRGEIELTINVEGPLKIDSPASVKLNLEDGKNSSAIITMGTKSTIGLGKISIGTKGISTVKKDFEISVRPPSPVVTEFISGSITGGTKLTLDKQTGFLESTKKSTLSVSMLPTLELAKHMKYLVGYPYGCLEQTVSKVFPQLYFEELAKLAAPEYYTTNNPKYFVKEGIRKIESMQLYDGSFSYWEGGSYSNVWVSVYATHFLVEANIAGFNTNNEVIEKALNYLNRVVNNKRADQSTRLRRNKIEITNHAKKEVLYALFVLALADKPDKATMNYYKSNIDLLTTDSQYLLAASFGLAGEMNSFYNLLPKASKVSNWKNRRNNSFDSEIRANAIILYTLLTVDKNNEKIPFMIKHLSKISKSIYSTQERAFALLSLGKAASENSEPVKIEILKDGKVLSTFNGKDLRLTNESISNSSLVLDAIGEGKAYYNLETEGIKLSGKVVENDSYMKVRKEYYNYRTGLKNNSGVFNQGDLYVAKISLTGFEQSSDNIVISDLIPSGLEIENPRLKKGNQLNWETKNPMNIDYLDIRDDRLFIFTKLNRKKTVEFFYLARAVTKGSFVAPAIAAEAMYDGEIHSTNGFGKIIIK